LAEGDFQTVDNSCLKNCADRGHRVREEEFEVGGGTTFASGTRNKREEERQCNMQRGCILTTRQSKKRREWGDTPYASRP